MSNFRTVPPFYSQPRIFSRNQNLMNDLAKSWSTIPFYFFSLQNLGFRCLKESPWTKTPFVPLLGEIKYSVCINDKSNEIFYRI